MTSIIALAEGTRLAGDFVIERVLGAGGFGITYLAKETALNRPVTIKEYFPSDFAARKDGCEAVPRSQESAPDYSWGLERFVDEAKILARFNHPHIVGVHRYFRENNTAYMVLHYEEGQSLKSWLQGLGRVPRQADLDRVVAPLLDALEVIHAEDFLHRDIAPDNIIIRRNGQPVLIDFGAARGEIARHSKTISALVKPGYSPYEQYAEKNSRQGPWTDIYALGATLYFAMTKKRPPDAVLRVTKDEYRPVGEVALGSYRRRFLGAIDKSLMVDIASRPQSIGAWRGELLGPDTPRRSWLTGRQKPAPADDPLAPDLGDPGVTDAAPAGAETAAAHAPPPPDAPGRRGGIADFVDNLKQPHRPLAAALKGAAGADAAVETNPKERAEAKARAKARAEPAARPDGQTVRVDPPPAAMFARKRQAAPVQPQAAPGPAPASDGAILGGALPGAAAMPGGRAPQVPGDNVLPVPVEPVRRPPKPPGSGVSESIQRTFWNLFKLAVAGGVAYGVYINREHLPALEWEEIGGYIETMLPSPGETSSGVPPPPAKSVSSPGSGSARDGSSAVADAATEAPPVAMRVRTIDAHEGAVDAIAYDDTGGRVLTAGSDGTLRIFSADSGAMERLIRLGHGPATALAVRGRSAATGHRNGHTAVWDLDAGTQISDLRRNEAPIWSLAFTRSGRLAAASHDWTVSLWDIRKPDQPVHVFDDHGSSVQALAHAKDSDILASGGADRRLRLWDLNTLDKARTYRKQSDYITAIAFSADNQLVASGTLSGGVSVFRTRSQSRLRSFTDHDAEVTAMAFSPDGRLLVTGSKDGTVRVRETRRYRTIKTLPDHQGPVTGLAFAPGGRTFATAGADGKVRIWATAAFER